MRWLKAGMRLAALAAPLLALAGEPGAKPLVLGLSLPDASYPVYAEAKRAADAEAAALGGVQILFERGGFLVDTQTLALERFVEQKVNGIIVCPLRPGSMGGAIDAAVAAGVPVVKLLTGPGGDRAMSTVTVDASQGGRRAARFVVERLGDKGTVVELTVLGPVMEAFRTGFEQELATSHVKLRVAEPTDFYRAQADQTVSRLLARHVEFDGVVAVNDLMALGAVDALRRAGVDPASKVILGWDAIPEARKAVQDGVITATLDPRPGELARTAVRTLVEHLRGGKAPEELVLVAPELITRQAQPQGVGSGTRF